MRIDFIAREAFTDEQQQAFDRLRAAVYPPEVIETLPGRFFSWAAPQWSLLIWEGEELVSRVGLVVREVRLDEALKRIGGVGGVMTHPDQQGRGFASQGMREAARLFTAELNADWALLFCRPHLVPFYQRLMWQPFSGSVMVEQPYGKIDFSANGAMVLDAKEPAPRDGALDLNGLPW